jgi:hypothetical protein
MWPSRVLNIDTGFLRRTATDSDGGIASQHFRPDVIR